MQLLNRLKTLAAIRAASYERELLNAANAGDATARKYLMKLWAEKGLSVSGGSSCPTPSRRFPQVPPNSFIAWMNFNPFGLGYVDNQQVNLPFPCTRVGIIGTGSNAASAGGTNNIYLTLQPVPDTVGNTSIANGRRQSIMNGSLTSGIFPLQDVRMNANLNWKFPLGLPSTVYLSGDYQGDGQHLTGVMFSDDAQVEFETVVA